MGTSIVMLKHDTFEKCLKNHAEVSPIKHETTHEKFNKAQSMLLTICNRIHFFENMEEDEILSVVKMLDFYA